MSSRMPTYKEQQMLDKVCKVTRQKQIKYYDFIPFFDFQYEKNIFNCQPSHFSPCCAVPERACISIPTFMAQYFLLPLFLKVYISCKECQSSSPFGEKVNLHTLETIYTSTPILYLKPAGLRNVFMLDQRLI